MLITESFLGSISKRWRIHFIWWQQNTSKVFNKKEWIGNFVYWANKLADTNTYNRLGISLFRLKIYAQYL